MHYLGKDKKLHRLPFAIFYFVCYCLLAEAPQIMRLKIYWDKSLLC